RRSPPAITSDRRRAGKQGDIVRAVEAPRRLAAELYSITQFFFHTCLDAIEQATVFALHQHGPIGEPQSAPISRRANARRRPLDGFIFPPNGPISRRSDNDSFGA